MANYKKNNVYQSSLMAISFEQQILRGTFEFTLHHLIEDHLDLSAFDDIYKNDGGGRAAYDPAVMLKIILFAYSKGITSSREIALQCQNNVQFMALSGSATPHDTRIAAFVSTHAVAIESVFEQILLVCDQQGLLGKELFAIDGCKIPSNAAKEWSGNFKELEAKRAKIKRQINHYVEEHQRRDKLDPDYATEEARTEQTLDTLTHAFNKIDQFLRTHTPRMGKAKKPKEVKSNITDNESAKMTTSTKSRRF